MSMLSTEECTTALLHGAVVCFIVIFNRYPLHFETEMATSWSGGGSLPQAGALALLFNVHERVRGEVVGTTTPLIPSLCLHRNHTQGKKPGQPHAV